jgi:hypothetical protein
MNGLMGSGGSDLAVRGLPLPKVRRNPQRRRIVHTRHLKRSALRQIVSSLLRSWGTRLSNGPETLDGIIQRVPRCEMARPRFRKCTSA